MLNVVKINGSLVMESSKHLTKGLLQALVEAKKGDVILLAGKGHEVTQQIGSTMIPFSDRELAKRLTEKHS